jgi:hypothetical protein
MADDAMAAFFEEWERELRAGMTPFERYLHETGRFDDLIYPEIPAAHVVVESHDHCIDVGCEHCIGYWVRDGKVSYCTHECHKAEPPEVPYNHRSYTGCADCPEIVRQGKNVSHCTCAHHRSVH